MASLTLALPILPGKLESWRRLCQELAAGREGQQQALHDRLGVHALQAWIVQSSNSYLALLQVETDQPDRLLPRLIASDHPFHRWLRRELQEMQAVDLDLEAGGPRMEFLCEWRPSR